MALHSISKIRNVYSGIEIPNTKNPYKLFSLWFKDACNTTSNEPNAMVLSTVNRTGTPRSRFVLLKSFNSDGFCFFTNSKSDKGIEIDNNKKASLLFYWPLIHRQIRIEGIVKKLPVSKAKEYFYSRPRGSQIASLISSQSRKLNSRKELITLYAKAEQKFRGVVIPFPKDWSGYILVPSFFEFWSGMPSRLHDRISYSRVGSLWKKKRLFP